MYKSRLRNIVCGISIYIGDMSTNKTNKTIKAPESDVRKDLAEIRTVIEILKRQVTTLANVLGISQPMYTEEEYKEIAEYRKRKGQ